MFSEERKPNGDVTYTVKSSELLNKTEAYLVEVITQKLSDIFIARFGERIIQDIDIESIRQNIEYEVHNILRDHKDISALRGEGSNTTKKTPERTGGSGDTDVFTGL